jgi:AMMECR1 domain-containing protein
VAPEQGWDRDETLSHLARKAGMASDGWKEGASFAVYEAIVFAEGELK